MEKISFTKMSGAGNDFIIIDGNKYPDFSKIPAIIPKLCDRRNGIGADGLIIISDTDNYDFKMDYYNADGSTKTLCGNGARCAIKFAQINNKLKNGKAFFTANDENYSGEILNNPSVKFNLNTPKNIQSDLKINIEGTDVSYYFADTGSPHVVIIIAELPSGIGTFYSDIDKVPVMNIGREIRYHKDFLPGGTNVNFIKIVDNRLLIRTYERGVEDETLACGTGAAASAVVASLFKNLKPPVYLLTKGGDELIVDFKLVNGNIKNLSLSGSAKIIYDGNFILQTFS
jgi:diaminopimelate epimerase